MIDIRIAAVACRSMVGEIEDNLANTIAWTRQAAQAGADLVCFPELNITGYVNGAEMASLALPIPGQVTRRLTDAAAQTGLVILAGLAEVNPAGPPFASHCVFHPDGRLECYRKLHLAPPERSFFSPGAGIPVFQIRHAVFGIQLCYDGHFPQLSAAMAAKGAEILFMPHASPRGDADTKHQSWLRHLPARAFDNSLFVVACNQQGANGKGLAFPGNALVLDPSGRVMEKYTGLAEHMLIADLKAAALESVRSHPMRYFFPNRRTDLY